MNSGKANFNLKNVLWLSSITALYLILSATLVGFKTDQLFLAALVNVLYYASTATRKFVLGFSIFVVFWIVFDFMKIVPNYLVNNVHIQDLYEQEKLFFGINYNNERLTPNEFFGLHCSTFLDILSGVIYLNWMPIPLVFAFFLFKRDKKLYLRFALAFLFVNLIGFCLYYIYPAAPPWYVAEYGFDFIKNTPGHTGALGRFDNYFHVKIFHGLYAKSSNVFAAMPSLHSAYPVVVFYYGLKKKSQALNIFFAIFMLGIWFAAVYTNHHYVQDVLAGVLCAIVGLFIFEKILMNRKWFIAFIEKYKTAIS